LEVAAEWGLVGVAALLWALWVALAAVRRVGRGRGTRSSAAGPAAAADAALARGGLAVLAVLALVHFPFRIALTGYPALLWLAWTLRRAAELEAGEGAAPEATAAAGRRRPPARWLAWGVVLLLAAGLALETERARRLMRASRLLNAAERTTVALAARGRLPGALLWANLRLLREAEELDPASVGVVVAAAGQQLLLDRPQEAVATYRRALALEPRPEVWINLGRAQWAAGERDEALASWTAAVRLDRRLLDGVPPEARARVERAAAGGGAAR
jgi:tetratricopeptide (TPR) repeat protein